jgi:hypothetical protein
MGQTQNLQLNGKAFFLIKTVHAVFVKKNQIAKNLAYKCLVFS